MKGYLPIIGTLTLAAAGCQGTFEGAGMTEGPSEMGPSEPGEGGESPLPPGTPGEPALSEAEGLFMANVGSIVAASCSPGGACHSTQAPVFVKASPQESYLSILAVRDVLFPAYDGAKLINYGNGTHNGAVFTPADGDQISGWLAAEKREVEANGPVLTAMQIWSGCMNLVDWEDEDVADLWANKNANGQGDCDACHNLGADGFFASNDSQRVFNVVTTLPSQMPSYFTLDAAGTNVIINRARLEKVGNQLEPHQAHGGFNVDGNAMEALQRFYDKTVARQAAGLCDPPRY